MAMPRVVFILAPAEALGFVLFPGVVLLGDALLFLHPLLAHHVADVGKPLTFSAE